MFEFGVMLQFTDELDLEKGALLIAAAGVKRVPVWRVKGARD
jgi:hypothetical protein